MESIQARLDQRATITNPRCHHDPKLQNINTVDAVVTTASGDEGMLMVLDEDGKLLA